MNLVTIHKLAADGATCELCGTTMPPVPAEYVQPSPGEFVGAVIAKYAQASYRIGKNNQDSLCDGTPAQEFSQSSVASA
jgi:hypothetical protein